MKQDAKNEAPIAPKRPKKLSIHEDIRIDDYYWLNQREDPEVLEYLKAENEYKEKTLAHLKDFRQTLFAEMKGRIKEEDQSVPYKNNGYYYLIRYEKGGEYPIYARKKETLEAPEKNLAKRQYPGGTL